MTLTTPHKVPCSCLTSVVPLVVLTNPTATAYTGYEPTSMRAIRARYDPYLQTRDRVEQLRESLEVAFDKKMARKVEELNEEHKNSTEKDRKNFKIFLTDKIREGEVSCKCLTCLLGELSNG